MTAEIGVLNKTGVVLAADSATTITKSKIVKNHATKIFSVSPSIPLGIMVFNVASWMGIPFEIIIPSFKRHLGEKELESTLDYVNCFIKFLRNYFIDKKRVEDVSDFISYRTYVLLDFLKDEVKDEKKRIIEDEQIILTTIKQDIEFETKVFKDLLRNILKEHHEERQLSDFTDYTIENFKHDFAKVISPILDSFYKGHGIKRSSYITKSIYEMLHTELTHSFSKTEDFSGLVFAGYGQDEIFPTIIEVRLGEVIGERLRFELRKSDSISHKNNAIIAPFAQREVIDMFIQGVDSILLNNWVDSSTRVFSSLEEEILKDTRISKSKLNAITKKALSKLLKENQEHAKEKHITPAINAVSLMRRDEMRELAESLISLTALKRKTSLQTESVGGPVDVAFITKTEGFVWLKKK